MNKYIYFDDLSEFWKKAMSSSRAWRKESRSETNDWSGGVSWEEAKKMALKGWKEGMEEVEKYRAKISPLITDQILRPVQIYSSNGYCVDVGVFLSNDPECFITRAYEESNNTGKIIRLVCSISASAAISPKTIIQRGSLICALVDALEYAGHRVELVCNMAVSANGKIRNDRNNYYGWFEVDVKIKPSDQPVDISSIAFCLAHPAMLRRMMFSLTEICGWSDYASNYGYPAVASEKGDIYIEEVFSGIIQDSEAVDWVLEKLKEFGVELEIKN